MEGTMMMIMMMSLPSVCRTTSVRADQHQGDERWNRLKMMRQNKLCLKPKFQVAK